MVKTDLVRVKIKASGGGTRPTSGGAEPTDWLARESVLSVNSGIFEVYLVTPPNSLFPVVRVD